jgi:carbon storage regulator
MLVLTRKVGERIVIGDDIRIEVTRISKHEVRIGVIAPDLQIDREEVRVSKDMENVTGVAR